MSDELPLVFTLHTPGTNAGAVDTEVYCVNVTSEAVRIAVSSTGFTTIDDDGTLLHHGSGPADLTLAPGAAARIGDVVAWEWDGHVGLVIDFTGIETGITRRATYNLKHGIGNHPPPPHTFAGKGGYITPPGVVQTVGAES
ncbi:MAG: hypothetical protein JWM87_1693 [Candidatus Eremiobacteraeota bacterium]|nr:hypothetical protein [Candidatus Eremiobacteraeota bacterium]